MGTHRSLKWIGKSQLRDSGANIALVPPHREKTQASLGCGSSSRRAGRDPLVIVPWCPPGSVTSRQSGISGPRSTAPAEVRGGASFCSTAAAGGSAGALSGCAGIPNHTAFVPPNLKLDLYFSNCMQFLPQPSHVGFSRTPAVRCSPQAKRRNGFGTTLRSRGGTALGTSALESIKVGKAFYGEVPIFGTPYVTGYEPIKDNSGNRIGVYYVATRSS